MAAVTPSPTHTLMPHEQAPASVEAHQPDPDNKSIIPFKDLLVVEGGEITNAVNEEELDRKFVDILTSASEPELMLISQLVHAEAAKAGLDLSADTEVPNEK